VGLGGEVDDHVDPVPAQQILHSGQVVDVGPDETGCPGDQQLHADLLGEREERACEPRSRERTN
jgi:hypothetical protein